MSTTETIPLPPGRKVYFASDFHLGAPDAAHSRQREQQIVRWLDTIQADAELIFLVGDIFDFWFEYKKTIPKGFIRLFGKLAELTDKGHRIIVFTGNHDMWMETYFTDEMGIPVYRQPRDYIIGNKRFFVGHGDGLGPGDETYKKLKVVFEHKFARKLFRWLHPDIGIQLANAWSKQSRLSHYNDEHTKYQGPETEWLFQYSRTIESQNHHDYYVFGHRHIPLNLEINPNSRYVNIGEWILAKTYGVFDGDTLQLEKWTM
ncbi:UDP-2,3-diacylglucosamine diphosphatase [Spirosoma validum]|uniref:UDP-2,3-diacylglucosamine diphosphatase n=1 Tax=Spirosoma validum TaxID=2771355 RepID=A0A927B8U1_9BACT|nr:UDP-2,3-diacylglucosamine diphosphatase [Spirosoma validum]MBD2757321.1 UDP-2,3-diacylglucosamine diphosphatase [Spirosoma validum]